MHSKHGINPGTRYVAQHPSPHVNMRLHGNLYSNMMHTDYLEKILTAHVYDVAIESPLEPALRLSQRLHNSLLLKREDMQSVFSFKLRGAYNKMAQLTHAQREQGVITASAGNHAQGVALAAHTHWAVMRSS